MRTSHAVALIASLLAAAAWAAPALAHGHLEMSTIADGDEIAMAPHEMSMTFSEPVAIAGASLATADGTEVPLDFTPSRDMNAMHTLALPMLQPGGYTFSCRVLGDDGHVVTETIGFTVMGAGGHPEHMGAQVGHMGDGSEDGHMHSDAGHMHDDD